MFPIVLSAVVIYVLKLVSMDILIIKMAIAAFALLWATLSNFEESLGSISFMNVIIEEQKKIIAIYPIFLFYLFIDWFILFI